MAYVLSMAHMAAALWNTFLYKLAAHLVFLDL